MVASGLGTLSLNVGTGVNFVSIDGGVAQLDTNLGVGGGNLTVVGHNSAVINFASSQRLAGLTLTESARVNLTAVGSQVLRVNNLSLEPDSVVDIATHSMIVLGTLASRAGVLANIRSWIRSGRNGGAWNGGGIISTAAAADSSRNTGLAAIINDRGDGSVVRSELGGVPVDANSILIKWTYNGDSDLNGIINADDYARLDLAFASGSGPTDYFSGDFNYSNTTNSDDYFLIDKAYSGQGTVLSDGPAAFAAESQTTTRHAPRRQHHHRRAKRETSATERAWLMFRHAQ